MCHTPQTRLLSRLLLPFSDSFPLMIMYQPVSTNTIAGYRSPVFMVGEKWIENRQDLNSTTKGYGTVTRSY